MTRLWVVSSCTPHTEHLSKVVFKGDFHFHSKHGETEAESTWTVYAAAFHGWKHGGGRGRGRGTGTNPRLAGDKLYVLSILLDIANWFLLACKIWSLIVAACSHMGERF